MAVYQKIVNCCPGASVILIKKLSYFPYSKKYCPYAPIFWKNGAIDFKNILYAHLAHFADKFVLKTGQYRTKNLYMPSTQFLEALYWINPIKQLPERYKDHHNSKFGGSYIMSFFLKIGLRSVFTTSGMTMIIHAIGSQMMIPQ